jgi:hypothetical protein
MLAKDIEQRHARFATRVLEPFERWGLHHAKADEQADRHEHDREQKRNSPSPREERRLRNERGRHGEGAG